MKSAKQILKAWKKTGDMPLATVERVFGLPQRSLEVWLSRKKAPADVTALLRIIDTYPWLISVANADFDAAAARRYHVSAAVELITNKIQEAKDASKV